jgi:IS5 family transposase
MTKISRFTERYVSIAQSVTNGRGESAALEGGRGFVDYAYVSLYCLRIYYRTYYDQSLYVCLRRAK